MGTICTKAVCVYQFTLNRVPSGDARTSALTPSTLADLRRLTRHLDEEERGEFFASITPSRPGRIAVPSLLFPGTFHPLTVSRCGDEIRISRLQPMRLDRNVHSSVLYAERAIEFGQKKWSICYFPDGLVRIILFVVVGNERHAQSSRTIAVSLTNRWRDVNVAPGTLVNPPIDPYVENVYIGPAAVDELVAFGTQVAPAVYVCGACGSALASSRCPRCVGRSRLVPAALGLRSSRIHLPTQAMSYLEEAGRDYNFAQTK